MASPALPVVLIAFLVSFFLLKDPVLLCSADPTDGFRHVPLTESNFLLQKPYNLASADRYSYSNGIRRLWVFSTDKPFKSDSSTDPRTEIRIKGYDYSSGVTVFVDGVMKHEAQGRGRSDFFFKFGVYGQIGESNRMESRWRDVKIFKK
ncbi:Citrate-binding protein [Platanthera guangdongensis]|uniref:Citrate-binding protein n=1 Tax=Platanthera guangdongensis TaxID=2320717 RepID=A0ABR2MQ77_9ASPA